MNTRSLNAQPWRFEPGDTVYVRNTPLVQGWPEGHTGKVVGTFVANGCPHYRVVDGNGVSWDLAQIHLCRSPRGEVQ